LGFNISKYPQRVYRILYDAHTSDNFTQDSGLGPWFRAEKIRECLAETFFNARRWRKFMIAAILDAMYFLQNIQELEQ
jgi:hypothetical protein